jgi:nucleotide-binding universal stress UspA family protein
MYTIIIPVDFSETSLKAVEVGKYLALRTDGTIYLVHYYGMMLHNFANPEAALPIDMVDQIRVAAEHQMKELAASVQTDGMTVKTVVEMGDLKSDIIELSKQLNADMIVLGTVGSGSLINKLIGSNASHIMERSTIPVMLVPKDFEFKGCENAVFADDFKSENAAFEGQLIDFAINTGLKTLNILYVDRKDGSGVVEIDESVNRLRSVIGENRIQVEAIPAMSVEKGIEEYVKNHPTDLIIMATEKKSLLQRLFVYGHTQVMAMHTHIPLLVYHR